MTEKIWISTAEEIGKVLGVSKEKVPVFVKKYGLPAFKIEHRGPWIAIPEDLERWAREQREKYLERKNPGL